MGWKITPRNAVQREGDEGQTTYQFDFSYEGAYATLQDQARMYINLRDITTGLSDGVTITDVTAASGASVFSAITNASDGERPSSPSSPDKTAVVRVDFTNGYDQGKTLFTVSVGVTGDKTPEKHELFALDLKQVTWAANSGVLTQEEVYRSAYGVVWNDDIGEGGSHPEKSIEEWPGFDKMKPYDKRGIKDQFGRKEGQATAPGEDDKTKGSGDGKAKPAKEGTAGSTNAGTEGAKATGTGTGTGTKGDGEKGSGDGGKLKSVADSFDFAETAEGDQSGFESLEAQLYEELTGELGVMETVAPPDIAFADDAFDFA
ncbi:MAG: hypothetical protein AAF674_02645 [Pseudomonadota bacterium]